MNIFYFSVKKLVEDMSLEELNDEIESAERYFGECRRYGQGVGSKEGGRYRKCLTFRNALELQQQQ